MTRWLLSFDVTAVLLFVIVGRNTHNEESSATGVIETATPFLIALVLSWLIIRAWQNPTSWRTGLWVWAITLGGGMALRRTLFDDGTAIAFVIVAAGFLGATMTGWRLLTRRLPTRRIAVESGVDTES